MVPNDVWAAPIWHDVECGGYAEDLPVWEGLAASSGSPVLDLGCGTGRVALHLARRGHEVDAVDIDPALVGTLRERAGAEGLAVHARVADVRRLDGGERAYPLVIAAMQLLQLLGGAAGRAAALEGIAGTLAPGGTAALAIVEGAEGAVGSAGPETVPDVREIDGWIHSSLPLDVAARNGHLEVRRLRQLVAPGGGLTESEHIDRLDVIDAETLEAEGRAAGLVAAGRRQIAESQLHVGSAVVLLEKEA